MLDEVPRTIRLYGTLAARFGREHAFVCRDTAGAVRALCQMVPGFESFLNDAKAQGRAFACFIGKTNIGEKDLHLGAGQDVIKIVPVIQGAGRGGALQIVLGVALVAGAFITGGASLGAGGVVFSGLAGQMAFGLGVSLALGGVAQMLVKQQDGLASVESPDNRASYNFNGPVQLSAQGNPVPVMYGEGWRGSNPISADLLTEDIQ